MEALTVVENMGKGSSKFDEAGFESIYGGAWEGLLRRDLL